jgi:hypothetical protein
LTTGTVTLTLPWGSSPCPARKLSASLRRTPHLPSSIARNQPDSLHRELRSQCLESFSVPESQ